MRTQNTQHRLSCLAWGPWGSWGRHRCTVPPNMMWCSMLAAYPHHPRKNGPAGTKLNLPSISSPLMSPYSLMAEPHSPERCWEVLDFLGEECGSVTHFWPKRPDWGLLKSIRDYQRRLSSLLDSCEKLPFSSFLPDFKLSWVQMWYLELGNYEGRARRREAKRWTQSSNLIIEPLRQACIFLSQDFCLWEKNYFFQIIHIQALMLLAKNLLTQPRQVIHI